MRHFFESEILAALYRYPCLSRLCPSPNKRRIQAHGHGGGSSSSSLLLAREVHVHVCGLLQQNMWKAAAATAAAVRSAIIHRHMCFRENFLTLQDIFTSPSSKNFVNACAYEPCVIQFPKQPYWKITILAGHYRTECPHFLFAQCVDLPNMPM